jgi:cytochrome c-type biogenesis protein
MEPQAQAGWIVAIVAGFLSFVSPCVLPLIPGYLSMISGLSAEQLEQRAGRQLARVLVSSVLFAVGLGVVFTALGASAGLMGRWLGPRMAIVNVVFGLVVIVFGLFVLNLVKLPSLYRDRRLRLAPGRFGIWGAPLLGIAFGLGWTPCVGPWLASLYSIAANIPPAQAAGLFAIYSASLGLCFVATGMLFAYALRAFAFFQRHYRAVEVVSGVLLIIIGLLLVTQQWGRATAALMALAG